MLSRPPPRSFWRGRTSWGSVPTSSRTRLIASRTCGRRSRSRRAAMSRGAPSARPARACAGFFPRISTTPRAAPASKRSRTISASWASSPVTGARWPLSSMWMRAASGERPLSSTRRPSFPSPCSTVPRARCRCSHTWDLSPLSCRRLRGRCLPLRSARRSFGCERTAAWCSRRRCPRERRRPRPSSPAVPSRSRSGRRRFCPRRCCVLRPAQASAGETTRSSRSAPGDS